VLRGSQSLPTHDISFGSLVSSRGATHSLIKGIDKLRNDLAASGLTVAASAESTSTKKPLGSLLERNGVVTESQDDGGNSSAAIRASFEKLRHDLGKEWKSWTDLSAEVWPKVDRLALEAKRMDQALTSAQELRLPSVVGLCSSLEHCSDCAASPICGWCASSMRCVPGGLDGPVDSALCTTTAATDYLFERCPGMSCPSYTSCGPCTADGLCGWCASTSRCLEGSEWGPSGHDKVHFESRQPCDHIGNSSDVTACADPKNWVHRDSSSRHTCVMPSPETTEVDFLKH